MKVVQHLRPTWQLLLTVGLMLGAATGADSWAQTTLPPDQGNTEETNNRQSDNPCPFSDLSPRKADAAGEITITANSVSVQTVILVCQLN
ncbi:MAG: hypothetical protein F6K65_38925, partial [Moorea sp. SIO3C2]|nr:hypothetical protein [Moorena sp. SIO3C2]